MAKLFRSNPLFFVFLLPIIVDVVGTVTGQASTYWSSNYQTIDEAAPVYPLLQLHPLAFIFGTLILWLAITYFLVKILKYPLNLWLSLALFAGHSYNSIYWFRLTQRNWAILSSSDRLNQTFSLIPMIIYIFLISFIAMHSLIYYFNNRNSAEQIQP